MNWTGIPNEDYWKVQEVVRVFIAKALKINKIKEINFALYEDFIIEGTMQVWVLYKENFIISGVIITKIGWFHGSKICSVPIIAGSCIELWEEFVDKIFEPWCKENEVDKIEVRTRKGIGKLSTRHGYRVSEVICTKDLEY